MLGSSGQAIHDILRQTSSSSIIGANHLPDQNFENDSHVQQNKMDEETTDKENLNPISLALRGEYQDSGERSLDALRKTLIFGHMCPTAPDTLSCHPFTVGDPFIIHPDRIPQILFAGCQVSHPGCTGDLLITTLLDTFCD